MSDADGLRELVVLDETVPAGKPWGHAVGQGEILRLVDLEGQQAVDFLCFDAAVRLPLRPQDFVLPHGMAPRFARRHNLVENDEFA